MKKTKFVIADLLILEEFCNLKCGYCEGFSLSEFKFRLRDGHLLMPEVWKKTINSDPVLKNKLGERPTVESFFHLANEILEVVHDGVEFPILKVSGGEIFLYNNLVDFVRNISGKYNAIQLLSNGTLFSKREIEQFSDIGNVYFQISLDSHTLEGNYSRSRSLVTLEKILKNITNICARDIGLEINCVLTKYNTDLFIDFVKYLNDIGEMTVFPRPVRGRPSALYFPTEEQVFNFGKLRDCYDQYSRILPPRSYFERVLSVIENKYRDWNCYIPFFVLGLNNYGKVSTCTCSSELPNIGSIFNDERVFQILQGNEQYKPTSKPLPCVDCITQYEIFNLYFENVITADDLKRIPTFRIPGALETAQQIKRGIAK